MANKHGLSARLVKKQAASRRLAKGKKMRASVYIGNESSQTRYSLSYKKRQRYFKNKESFPKRKLPTKDPLRLIEMGIIDKRGFFLKGKKKNYITKSMVDRQGLDFWGMPRAERPSDKGIPDAWKKIG